MSDQESAKHEYVRPVDAGTTIGRMQAYAEMARSEIRQAIADNPDFAGWGESIDTYLAAIEKAYQAYING